MKGIDEHWAWGAFAPGASGPEADAAALVSSVEDPAPLSPQAVARIRAGVLRSRTSAAAGVRVPRTRRWSVAFAALLLGASVTTATGTTLVWRAVSRRTAAQPTKTQEPSSAPSRRAPRGSGPPRRRALSDPPPPFAPLAAPPQALAASPSGAASDTATQAVSHAAKIAEVTSNRVLAPRTSGHPPLALEGADHPDPRRLLARGSEPRVPLDANRSVEAPPTEARLLGESVRLNQEGDAAGALRLLDRYAAMYPAGVLAIEARRVRLAALLRSGDHRTALALVDTTPTFGDLGADLLLVRAELRAEAHRCTEAIPDFERALDAGFDDATTERSVFGRAVCLARTGQHDRAHEAFVAYRVRFPRGRFSAEVARLLGETAADGSP